MKRSKDEIVSNIAYAITIILMFGTIIFCVCAIAGIIPDSILWIVWIVSTVVDLGVIVFLILVIDHFNNKGAGE